MCRKHAIQYIFMHAICNAGVAKGVAYNIADNMYVFYCTSAGCFSLFSLTAIDPGWGSGPFLAAEMRIVWSVLLGAAPSLSSKKLCC